MRRGQRILFLFLVVFITCQSAACASVFSLGMPVVETMKPVDTANLELAPCGMTIGVRINMRGVMVLGVSSFMGADGSMHNPSDGKLRPGDMILRINGVEMKNKEDLIRVITGSENDVSLAVQRNGDTLAVDISPVVSAKDQARQIGVYVRDSTKGIGTITYYNPATQAFGALGHGIMDVDTKKLMSVESGIIMASRVTSVKKGVKGAPGELEGAVQENKILGRIHTNSPCGIYGKADNAMVGAFPTETVKVAPPAQIHEGPATIRTNVASDMVREYDIYIENVNRFAADDTKSMVLRITDPELLKLTNGIVQGMSGSPILQDGMLAGAVTHVFVQDPTKGYGIFIESMLRREQAEN